MPGEWRLACRPALNGSFMPRQNNQPLPDSSSARILWSVALLHRVLHLLHDVDLLRAQVSVNGGDALHAVLAHDARCKRVGDDAWRSLRAEGNFMS